MDEYQGQLIEVEAHGRPKYMGALMNLAVGITEAETARNRAEGYRVRSPLGYQGLIDTGAEYVIIRKQIVDYYEFDQVDEEAIRRVDDSVVMTPVYDVHISFGGSGRDVRAVGFTSPDIPHDVLIGRSLLRYCELDWNGPSGTFTIRMP